MTVVLIPAYEPDEKLIELVNRLKSESFEVLVVDDGSGKKYKEIFSKIKAESTVITLEENCGKGAALKAGMKYISANMPTCEHFITCDADGQHKVEDVVRVREKLLSGEKFVLTTRTLKKGTPFRSKVGNIMSRVVYALLTNRYLSDNQSGLRGFAISHINWMVNVEKNNYDYEMNVLYYAAKKNIKIATLPIETIYIENNASSHFNPIGDTVKIYKSLFKLAMGTPISFLLTEVLIVILSHTLGYRYLFLSLPFIAGFCLAINLILTKNVFLKGTDCYDYWGMLIYTVISYIFYTLGCLLFWSFAPKLPLWVAFNISYVIGIPLKYYLHKFTFIASQTRE